MAGASSKTTAVGVRVPNDVLMVWQAEIGEGSISAHILARAMRPDLAPELVALQDDVARLKRELAAARRSVEAVASVRIDPPVDLTKRHPSGPILDSVVPSVAGEVAWSNLKSGKGKR